MTLLPGHNHVAVERAPTANLDRIAQCLLVARLTENAMIEFLASLSRPFQQLWRPVDGDAFLVTGDEERN